MICMSTCICITVRMYDSTGVGYACRYAYVSYEVATVSRIDKIIGLFCKRGL